MLWQYVEGRPSLKVKSGQKILWQSVILIYLLILDEDGAYYWHIKSGTIQRDAPPPVPPDYKPLSSTSDVCKQIKLCF